MRISSNLFLIFLFASKTAAEAQKGYSCHSITQAYFLPLKAFHISISILYATEMNNDHDHHSHNAGKSQPIHITTD
jgi:hypothetical protein